MSQKRMGREGGEDHSGRRKKNEMNLKEGRHKAIHSPEHWSSLFTVVHTGGTGSFKKTENGPVLIGYIGKRCWLYFSLDVIFHAVPFISNT